MTLLEQAKQLLTAPVTRETLNQLEALADKARNEEAEQIGDLIEAALVSAPAEVLAQYQASLL
ncbi:hypothetical protein VQ7734_04559 [Vibrio quintilis]|uniref:Uncharacterized protein n=2 Tax=Vibrio quintilis TaxID=1117707 RepID=A0A1M7Z1G2_9VIBR|nr:hypothetical protein VQ7734_04559 [Vibrio quintilis]